MGNLKAKVLEEGVHSGDGSGIIPDSFRICRQLIDRIEDAKSGEVHEKFQVTVPAERYSESLKTAELYGQEYISKFPFVKGMKPVSDDYFKCYMGRAWKAQLAVTVSAFFLN